MSERKKESIVDKRISRRSMLKWTGALAVAGAVGVGVGYGANELLRPIPPSPPETGPMVTKPEEEVVYATATNNGPHLTYVKNGRVIRSDTIPVPYASSYPKFKVGDKIFSPPLKSINGPVAIGYRKYTYATDRVQYPMKRVGFVPGGKGPVDNRGKGEFVRITWDEALDIVASEMRRINETYGLGAICNYAGSNTEQTTFEGNGSHTRLLSIFSGYTRVREPTYSSAGFAYGGPFIHGFNWSRGGGESFDLNEDVVTNSKMIVFWAENSLFTSICSDGPNLAHLMFFLKELGKKMVVIDPRYNDTAARYDTNWIPIIPGTDCAMMAAIAYVWITEGTYDQEYVATHTYGFDENSLPEGAPANSSFKAYITGTMDGVPKTPEWAEKICGVKARVIKALAREWASQPTMLCAGTMTPSNGAQRGPYGHEVARFQIALIAMQGYGKPGVNLWGDNEWNQEEGGWPSKKLAAPDASLNSVLGRAPSNKVKGNVLGMLFTEAILNHSATWIGYDLSSSPEDAFKTFTYPSAGQSEIKMLYNSGHSHFSARVNANKTVKAYMSPNLEFIVTFTPWWGGTDRYSDIVLPLSTLLEQSDIKGVGSVHSFIVYHGKCVDPLWESKSDWEACLALAKKLGIEDKFNPEGKSKDQLLEAAFNESDIANLMSYEDFKKVGYVYNPSAYDENYEPEVGQRWFYEKKGEDINADTGFATPSGKVEFFSQIIYKYRGTDDPRIAPVPKYYQAREGKYSSSAKTYPLIMLSSHRLMRFHGQHDNISMLRDCYKVAGPDGYEHEPIYMSPADAQARGIKDGDIVRVFNDRGAVLAGATITKTLMPGVVQIHQGSWYDPVDPRNPFLDRSGDANVLTHSEGQSEFGRCVPDVTALVEAEVWKG